MGGQSATACTFMSLPRPPLTRLFVAAAAERECLFPPCSFLEPQGGEAMEVTRYGIVGKLRVRVNANLKAPTLTELLNQKRNMHLASFRYLVAELGKELEELGRSEAAAAREGVDEFQPNDWRHKPTSEFIEHILSECRAVLRQHEAMSAEELLEDGAYRSAVAEALSVKEMGKKKFMLWLTGGPQKLFVMRRGLKQSYRDWMLRQEALLASMPREEDRRAAALELCRSVGLLRRSVDEVNVFGETPLFDVAADHERQGGPFLLANSCKSAIFLITF